MAGYEKAVGEISKQINELQKDVGRHSWKGASRVVFVNALDKSVSGLEDLRKAFAEEIEGLDANPKEGKPDLKPFLAELDSLLAVLEKNLGFEKKRKARSKTVTDLGRDETPELYAGLEQKVLGILLKARYSLERLTIFLRKQGLSPLDEKSTAKQVMQILERKEDELQDLREKYEGIRKKSYLGYLEEETVADLEHELGELGRRMTLSGGELGKSISFHKSQIEYIENSYAELKQKLDSLQETFFAYSEKSGELIKDLKKERDYAKKVVLDVEHETLQLRNTYTRELLGLQETRLAAKREAEKTFLGEIKKLKKQVSEQADLVKHFKKIAEDKLKKEDELEERVKKLSLLLKAKEKHEAVKRQLRGKKRKKKR